MIRKTMKKAMANTVAGLTPSAAFFSWYDMPM